MHRFSVLTFLVLSLFFLVGCLPTQQVVGINSTSVQMNEQQIFQYANDVLEIQYFFNGFQIPVRLRIENKRTEPLTINLANSFLIVQNRSLPWSSSPDHKLVIPPRSFVRCKVLEQSRNDFNT